jgi:ubiquinone/menaquinone biosynthesis C-methylase UbiE
MTDQASPRDQAFTGGSAATNYARYLVPYLFEPWATTLLNMVVIDDGSAVLDVAAGTGVVSRAAARRAGPQGRVLATDISPVMTAYIAAQPADPGAAPIETAVASATDLGCQNDEFDVVLCQQGLPFFPDRAGALREMNRVLHRGGVLGLAVWSGRHGTLPFGPFHEVFQAMGVPEPFPDAWNPGSFSMRPHELEELVQQAGFPHVVSTEFELITRWPDLDHLVDVVKGSPFAGLLAALPEEQQAEFRTRTRERYAEYEGPDRVRVPTYATLTRATA